MEVNNISSINCDLRNNYDKEFCNNLNPDKINNFLKPYIKDPFGNDSFFDKNIFYLEDKQNQINNINKNECAKYTIENNYEGFTYKGDNNKCLLFNSHNLNNKIDENTNQYNIKTFLKTKDVVDIKKLEDQLDSSKFFEESNNYGYIYDNNIKEYNVINIEQCMDKCIKDHNDCKSIMYLEEPNKCNFFNKKIMKNKNLDKDFENYDIYTVKKNKLKKYHDIINNLKNDIQNDIQNDENYYYCSLNNGNCLEDYYINKYENKNDDNLINSTDDMLYNCSGLYSTNPFCTNEYNPKKTIIEKDDINYSDCINIKKENNMFQQKNTYNNICKKQYGNEYIFDDNIFDKSTIIKCDNGEKIKCKLNFNSDYIEMHNKTNMIEHFNNIEENINNKFIKKIKIINIVYILLFLFLFIIGLFFIMYTVKNKKN
jgi:hypothetical protein